jgi:ubiquinone/menaquinone biosynthesis C-methylase UbiE
MLFFFLSFHTLFMMRSMNSDNADAGAVVPYLASAGVDTSQYMGIDISGGMISIARRRHPSSSFVHQSFLATLPTTHAKNLDCILFNGAIQFFADTEGALRRACDHVRPAGGRVVIAHANGARFVQEEKRGNPLTVVSIMPSLSWLEDRAEALGVRVIPQVENLDDFYLVVLEKL